MAFPLENHSIQLCAPGLTDWPALAAAERQLNRSFREPLR